MGGGETGIKIAHWLPVGEFTVYLRTCVLETQIREENTTPSFGGEWIREGSPERVSFEGKFLSVGTGVKGTWGQISAL